MTDDWERVSQKFFLQRLLNCEQHMNQIPDYAKEFIRDLRKNYNTRADAVELGATPWVPTVRQLNYLSQIADKL